MNLGEAWNHEDHGKGASVRAELGSVIVPGGDRCLKRDHEQEYTVGKHDSTVPPPFIPGILK